MLHLQLQLTALEIVSQRIVRNSLENIWSGREEFAALTDLNTLDNSAENNKGSISRQEAL